MQIRFYYQDEQYPHFGEYYCDNCALEAGMSYELSWVSHHAYCPTCGVRVLS